MWGQKQGFFIGGKIINFWDVIIDNMKNTGVVSEARIFIGGQDY